MERTPRISVPEDGGRPIRWLLITAAVAGLWLADDAPAKLSPATVAFWDRVAQCETRSNWRAYGPTYQGGLGFYWATWNWWARELGLLRRYPDAHLAPRIVQIRVADYGWRAHRGYWGCMRVTGYPPR